ncbi:hypothetical protein [Chondromyces crocatus]|uniref:hypothetical protein n=1 Tax=Chondromyces crocatus TaxID=52 RepID=UPI00067E40E5|nr:hypothetical protein [Chondromyces crocatus]
MNPNVAVDCDGEPNLEGPGYRICFWGVDVLNPGANELFYQCLSGIGVQFACDYEPVQSCVEELYLETCESPEIANICEQMATSCGQSVNDIDQQDCNFRMKPLSLNGVQQVADCIDNAPAEDDCQKAFSDCVDNLLADF